MIGAPALIGNTAPDRSGQVTGTDSTGVAVWKSSDPGAGQQQEAGRNKPYAGKHHLPGNIGAGNMKQDVACLMAG